MGEEEEEECGRRTMFVHPQSVTTTTPRTTTTTTSSSKNKKKRMNIMRNMSASPRAASAMTGRGSQRLRSSLHVLSPRNLSSPNQSQLVGDESGGNGRGLLATP